MKERTPKKSPSNAASAAKASASHAPWLFTRSSIWKSHPTSVHFAASLSTKGQT
ncbi:unnamed protein product [Acanthoscelides obtectus]|uniref:Uncharacterized protein n=1 Tax=Acanthoscelides obtectus TaxID=200917 RepID=A0A9P0PBR6_ACAOB|nr:unnamed protein product [Acanthoscelides obtectus]CAK1631753.1 hypothetical protein AOBTE_LOCUS7133 [Acanthoscelides obtectus]